MAYGIFIAENMASTKVGSLLRSVKQSTDIENGAVVKLGALVSGEADLYEAEAVAAVTDRIAIVDGVELDADESTIKGLDDFINEKEKPFRVRIPMVGDRFSVSASAITGATTIGQFVEVPATGNKLKASATQTATASFVTEVKRQYKFGSRGIDMVSLEVIKA